MENILQKRFDIIKDTAIAKNTANIDFDYELGLYDAVLEGVFNGEYDDVFISQNVEFEDENRKEIFALARKYSSLCFLQGEFDNWPDSTEGASLQDQIIPEKILDNYDFLLGLAKKGGEDTLKFLLNFQNTELSKKGAIIECLRNAFPSDETLEKITIEMAKKDGNYKDYSDKQKVTLYNYADGVLYTVEEQEEIYSGEELKNKILKCYIGDNDSEFDYKDIMKNIDDTTFNETIEQIYIDYQEKKYFK